MNLYEKNNKIPLIKLKLDLPEWRGISCSRVVIFKMIEASFLTLMYKFSVIPIQRLMNLSFSETKQVCNASIIAYIGNVGNPAGWRVTWPGGWKEDEGSVLTRGMACLIF